MTQLPQNFIGQRTVNGNLNITGDVNIGEDLEVGDDLTVVDEFGFNTGSTVNVILDEDDMVSDLSTALVTQQSVKAYTDNLNTVFQNSGIISGFDFTDSGTGSITIALGVCYIRSANTTTSPLIRFDVAASALTAIATNDTTYILVNYNAGAPIIEFSLVNTDNGNDIFMLYEVSRNGTVVIHVTPEIQHANNTMSIAQNWMYENFSQHRTDGLIIGETGTRNVTVTAGILWVKLNRLAISAIDTSAADTFSHYYHVAGVWTELVSQTQWDNLQYDDLTDLVTLTNNRYSYFDFYMESDGDLSILYGQAEFITQEGAENAPTSSTFPNGFNDHTTFLGRMVFQKSGATTVAGLSAFDTIVTGGVITDHGSLGGLSDDDHTQYVLRTDTNNLNIDLLNSGSDSTFTIQNSNVTYEVDLLLEGKLNIGDISASPARGRLKILGDPASGSSGPHLEIFTSSDTTNPIFQILGYASENISLCFDSYFDGTNFVSSASDSNFRFKKFATKLSLQFDDGIAIGNTITWDDHIDWNDDGSMNIYNSLNVDIITEHTTDSGVTIEGITLEDYNISNPDGQHMTVDLINSSSDSVLTLHNSHASYDCNMVIEGSMSLGSTIAPTRGRLRIVGDPGSTTEGPHIELFTTLQTQRPIMQLTGFGSDSTNISFDSFYDGTVWKSVSANSNYRFFKSSTALQLLIDTGITIGDTVAWDNHTNFDSDGTVDIYNSLKVDAINEHTGSNGVDIEGIKLINYGFTNPDGNSMTIDLINSSADSSLTIQNSNGTYESDLRLEGKMSIGDVAGAPTRGRLKILGTVNNITEGPHIELFTSDQASNPNFQIMSYAKNNNNIGFSAYFDGTSWRSSSGVSNYLFRELSAGLEILYKKSIPVGNLIVTWDDHTLFKSDGDVEIYGNLLIDGINELTGGNGVLIDGVRVKDYGFTNSDGNNMTINLVNSSQNSQLTITNSDATYAADVLIENNLRCLGDINSVGAYSKVISTRQLYIDVLGDIGTISSLFKHKLNINYNADYSWLYKLKPCSFNFKKQIKTKNGKYKFINETQKELQFGMIAEETVLIKPEICTFDQNKNLDGISYSKLVVPMLSEIQRLNKHITKVEQQLIDQNVIITELSNQIKKISNLFK